MNLFGLQPQIEAEAGQARMNFNDLANLLDNDGMNELGLSDAKLFLKGNLQNEMMVASFAATMLATIPVLLGNEFDVNVGLKKKRSAGLERDNEAKFPANRRISSKYLKSSLGME